MNFEEAKIYKIIDNTCEKVYIGSTCKTLKQRLAKHVSNYKCYLKGKYNNVMSFEIIKNGDYDILLVESFPCNFKDELLTRERYWTTKINCINKNKPGIYNELGEVEYHKQYHKNYYEENIEDFNEKGKLYRQVNKQKIKQYKTQPFQCDCGSTIQLDAKARHCKSKKHQQWVEENENN
jgi:hypothetical protein